MSEKDFYVWFCQRYRNMWHLISFPIVGILSSLSFDVLYLVAHPRAQYQLQSISVIELRSRKLSRKIYAQQPVLHVLAFSTIMVIPVCLLWDGERRTERKEEQGTSTPGTIATCRCRLISLLIPHTHIYPHFRETAYSTTNFRSFWGLSHYTMFHMFSFESQTSQPEWSLMHFNFCVSLFGCFSFINLFCLFEGSCAIALGPLQSNESKSHY